MIVKLIAYTILRPQEIDDWLKERGDYWPGLKPGESISGSKANGVELLCEFAGRLCYDSFSDRGKPDNLRYSKHILESGHGSVLEHANFSFLIDGVSRALTHELVRHRAGFAYSQLSTRFADPIDSKMNMITPPLLDIHKEVLAEVVGDLQKIYNDSLQVYKTIKEKCEKILPYKTGRDLRKAARQTARYILTHLIETRIVVTGNARAWRHMIEARGNIHADTEIRLLAVDIAKRLKWWAPSLFQDVEIITDVDEIESVKVLYSKV